MYTLFAVKGWGSVIAEAAFAFAGVPYRLDQVDLEKGGPARDRLRAANPLGQLPTVLMPDGTVLTESAAIILHLADIAPAAELAPAVGSAQRVAFLRWLIFIVAAIYPTFTYGDEPARYVEDEAARKQLRASTNQLSKSLWGQVEAAASAPYFLGDTFSAIDIYIWAMNHWRPGAAWFAEHCPKLTAIAAKLDDHDKLAEIRDQNFAG